MGRLQAFFINNMAWDLSFYGLDAKAAKEKLSQLWAGLDLPSSDLTPFQTELKAGWNAKTLDELVDYVCGNTEVGYFEVLEELGFVELMDFRSKKINYAINLQFGEYFEDPDEESFLPRVDWHDNCSFLTREELVGLLEWLIAVSHYLDEEPEWWAESFIAENIKEKAKAEAEQWRGLEPYKDFGVWYNMFVSWLEKVKKTDFEWFYWLNSY